MSTVDNTIKQIISDRVKGLRVEQIENTTPLTALGADSLDSVEIVMEIERTFKTSIKEEDFEKLQTVDQIIAFLESKNALS